ncbi:helix-turn-helix domain-containing protein [Streptomyces sp. AV19]|uniref:helix-turn-helix domain-containing protein n=1 Tax=Streptomyces sp. AV19 TaxID=2793068 RepID=UPI0018FE8C75|nr:XRE family transcriptional regulator [Streptomyces sp. AV19]MBH1935959.1 helix-turn-helix domain-containing protein [Streptomyces sp. AV19]MDG4534250.1 XRE family transcriptional regulator [Streptomyces sp. AV19]
MSGDRPPPAECAALAAELRALRERTGLSLVALAGRTPYSKSSWERYLNGKKLPPRQAVEALCGLADEPAGRLVALWDLAEQRWSGRSGVPERPSVEAAAEGSARRPVRTYVVSGTAVVLAVTAVLLFLVAGRDAGGGAGSPAAVASYPQSWAPGCAGADCEGADPQEMGCGAQGMAVTLERRRLAGGQEIAVRYAEKCGAVWAKASHLRIGDRVELSVPGADPKRVRAAGQRDTEVYLSTAMTVTAEPRAARVCFEGADGGRECFAPSKEE